MSIPPGLPQEVVLLQSLPWTIDAVGNDAYHWEVAFNTFDSSSPLAQVGKPTSTTKDGVSLSLSDISPTCTTSASSLWSSAA